MQGTCKYRDILVIPMMSRLDNSDLDAVHLQGHLWISTDVPGTDGTTYTWDLWGAR